MSEFGIRDAVSTDYNALLSMRDAAISGTPDHFYDGATLFRLVASANLNVYLQPLNSGDYFAVGVGCAGQIVGLIRAGGLFITELLVSPNAQRKGLGSSLLESGERFLKKNQVQVASVKASLSAEAFYAGRGWETQYFDVIHVRDKQVHVAHMTKDLRN